MKILPSTIQLQLKCHVVVSRALSVLLDSGLFLCPIENSCPIAMTIDSSLSRIKELEAEYAPIGGTVQLFPSLFHKITASPIDIDKIYLTICRLSLQTMHLHEDLGKVDTLDLLNLYITSCEVVSTMSDMDSKKLLISSCTIYHFYSLLVAATNLLRLIRGGLVSHIARDIQRGETIYLLAVSMMRRMSVANDDLPQRCSTMLSTLWTSRKVFRRPDGSVTPNLRIRSRLVMSSVVDCLWWYRVEAKGLKNVYGMGSRDPTDPQVVQGIQAITTLPEQLSDFPSQEALDNWAMSDDFSFPSFFDFNDFLR